MSLTCKFSTGSIASESSNKYIEDLNSNYAIENHVECNENRTPIQQFYENQSIFITGGTGFLGKVLIEKLLRSCPGISKIFILIRDKKHQNIDQRINQLLIDPIFEKCRLTVKDFDDKIQGINGDCSLKNLGLSENDADLLKQNVSIVFHVAATVRFDEKLKQATAINVKGTSSVVNLCKNMQNLKAIVHVSTAYSNCFVSDIEEKLYDYPINHKQLVDLMDNLPENMIEAITPRLIEPWPNTYTFTKALSEDLIKHECKTLPIVLFRPAVVTSSAFEPMTGWIDNYNGPIGLMSGVAFGVARTAHCDPDKLALFVPVDLTVNALIACAWHANSQENRRSDDILVYNFTSANDNPMTFGKVAKYIIKYVDRYPLNVALWCAIFRVTKYRLIYKFYAMILHLIPAYFIDFAVRISGQEPRLVKSYVKIHKMIETLSHFATRTWRFEDGNVKNMWKQLDAMDRQLFRFSMVNFNWDHYMANCMLGIRIFLFKDELSTLEKSQRNYKRFLYIHRLIIALFVGFACWILWKIYLMIFQ